MIFKTNRLLKNKVFSTSIDRVAEQDDPCAEEEKRLEDDFGPVSVEVGGTFVAYISKESEEKPTFTLTTEDNENEFKFGLDSKLVDLKADVKIPYSCDSNKETVRKFHSFNLNPLEVAELKCKIFEAVIKERIGTAVDKWKAESTDFEKEEIEPFEKHLV